MKRIVTSALLCLFVALSVGAQEQTWTFGIRAGSNIASFSKYDLGDSYTPGAMLGISAEYNVLPNFYLQTGIEAVLRRTKLDKDAVTDLENITRYDVVYKTRSVYMQIPIHAAYKYALRRDLNVVVSAGPYIAYGIDGKIKGRQRTNNMGQDIPIQSTSIDYDYFSKEGYKRFDAGLGVAIGAEYQHFSTRLGYDWGLVNAKRTFGVLRNRNAYLTLGYNI